MYTQCPSCRTLFRISEQQLAAARGKVRCGKCNHIYNAQGTLLHELPKPAAAPTPAEPQPETLPEETVFERDDIVDISNELPVENDDWLDEEQEFISDELRDEDIPSITPPSGVEEEDWQMINLGSDSDFSSGFEDDDDEDAWLFGDDETEDQGGVDIVLRNEDSELPEPVTFEEQTAAEDEEDSDFMRHMSDYLDDDRAEELISDESASNILDEVNQQLSMAVENPAPESTEKNTGINLPGDWDDFDEVIKPASSELSNEDRERQEISDAILKGLETSPAEPVVSATTPTDNKKPAAAEPSSQPSFTPFEESEDETESIVLEAAEELDIGHKIGQHDEVPLRIRDSVGIEEQKPRTALKWFAISGSIILLVFVLAIQIVMFRSADLANMYPELQPTLLSLCEKLPCRDSRRFDVHQIDLISRNINQHPRTKSALLIKAAIINRADFAQRYPKIQITLSDVTGDTVAQRIFYPQEYLGKLYHPFLMMKSNTPVHIALEVMDPGSAAINFEFKFL